MRRDRTPRILVSCALLTGAFMLDAAGRTARRFAARIISRATCYAAGRDPDAPIWNRWAPWP